MNGGRAKWIAEGRDADHRRPGRHAHRLLAPQQPTVALRAYATTSRPRSAARSSLWSTSARRRSSRASCWRRRTCRRRARSAAATSPAPRTSPGPPPSPRTAPSSRPRAAARSTAARASRAEQADDRLLPHRRAQRPHLVRADRAARPPQRAQLRRLLDRVGLAHRRPDRTVVRRRRSFQERLPRRANGCGRRVETWRLTDPFWNLLRRLEPQRFLIDALTLLGWLLTEVTCRCRSLRCISGSECGMHSIVTCELRSEWRAQSPRRSRRHGETYPRQFLTVSACTADVSATLAIARTAQRVGGEAALVRLPANSSTSIATRSVARRRQLN